MDSLDAQNRSVSYASEEGEDATTGSIAIQKLFRKWLLILRTQSSSPTAEVLSEKMADETSSEGQKVKLSRDTGQLLKSAVVHFLKLDAAVSLPLVIL